MTKAEFVFRKLEMGCWHIINDNRECYTCHKKGVEIFSEPYRSTLNPTFTDGNGMVMLARRIDEVGRWGDFYYYSWRSYFESLTKEERYIKFACDHTNWLINPPHFLDLVAKWLGWKEVL